MVLYLQRYQMYVLETNNCGNDTILNTIDIPYSWFLRTENFKIDMNLLCFGINQLIPYYTWTTWGRPSCAIILVGWCRHKKCKWKNVFSYSYKGAWIYFLQEWNFVSNGTSIKEELTTLNLKHKNFCWYE